MITKYLRGNFVLTTPRKLFEVLHQEAKLRNYGEKPPLLDSPKTIKAYKSCLHSFVNYFKPRHPRELSSEDIRSYLLYLIEEENFASSSVNQVFNALRSLFDSSQKRCVVWRDVSRNGGNKIKQRRKVL